MKIKSGEFITISACTMALTALGIDVMLPAFAELRKHFGLPHDSTETAKIVSFFFLGQVSQLLFGVLSDRYGRLPILRTGFPLYIIGGVAAAFAPTLPWMLAARFVAGMGASCVLMTTVAGVRDRYVGNEMARIMSLIFTIFLFTPVIAPFLGMAILSVSSWQMVFLSAPVFAVIVFIWSFRLSESLPKEKRVPLDLQSTLRSIKSVISNRSFLRFTAITTFLFTGLSSYVATSEHIVGDMYKQPHLFPWIFGTIGLLMACFTLMNARYAARFGAYRIIKFLMIAYTIVSTALLLMIVFIGDPPPMPLFFIAIALLLSINLAIEPNCSALALEPMGESAGVAAAIYGTSFFVVGSTIGALVSERLNISLLPLGLCFFVLSVLSLLLVIRNSPKKQ